MSSTGLSYTETKRLIGPGGTFLIRYVLYDGTEVQRTFRVEYVTNVPGEPPYLVTTDTWIPLESIREIKVYEEPRKMDSQITEDSNELRKNILQITEYRAQDYLTEKCEQQLEPVLHYQKEPLWRAIREVGGAKGISVPDPFETYQISLPIYMGFTTPQATSEIPHYHSDQAEAYILMEGEAEMLAKHPWIGDGWISRIAHAGDILLVQPGICHWFRWCSDEGLAYVLKGPQRAGVGAYPAGKTTCQKGCPFFGRGCTLPQGFEIERKAA